MNLTSNIKKWLRPRQYAGVELGQKGEAFYYHLVVLQEEKGEIKTVAKHQDLTDLDGLVAAMGKTDMPIFLSLNIRGILHKFIPGEALPERSLLEAVLPNAKTGEFFLQSQKATEGTWASVIRQENCEQILDQFAAKELWVTAVQLGPFGVQALRSFMRTEEPVATTTYVLDFDDSGKISALKKTSEETAFANINVEEEVLHSTLLPAFGGAFLGLLDSKDTLAIPQVAHNKEEFFHKGLFQTGGWALLLGLLAILVLNTFFYYQYKDANQQLSSQVLYADAQLQLLDSLQSQVGRQKDFMLQTSLNQNSKTSYYADRIAASLPSDLQLSQLEVFPMQGKSRDYREGQLIRYQKDLIYIKGFCKNSLTYNEWLNTLEGLDWVEQAEHLEYQDLSNRLGTFELQLLIAPSK